MGHIENPLPYFAAFDIFAMSSATEQMPLSLLEAMACGLPAVCTDVGDCAEMLGNEQKQYIVAAANVDAYSGRLLTLVNEQSIRKRLGSENRNRAVSTYSFEQMARAYRQLIVRARQR
jgi:glycosyltransferase involved in cell wall biosynthesis